MKCRMFRYDPIHPHETFVTSAEDDDVVFGFIVNPIDDIAAEHTNE